MIGRKAAASLLLPIVFVSLLALLFAPIVHASGDPFSAPSPGPGIIVIQGNWQFQSGNSSLSILEAEHQTSQQCSVPRFDSMQNTTNLQIHGPHIHSANNQETYAELRYQRKLPS